jgi:hypothetical protein
MRKYWSRSVGGNRLAGKVLPGWKPFCGVSAAASLAVTLAPGAAFAASAGVVPAAATVNATLVGVTARPPADA